MPNYKFTGTITRTGTFFVSTAGPQAAKALVLAGHYEEVDESGDVVHTEIDPDTIEELTP